MTYEESFAGFNVMAVIAAMLLLGVVLRAKIKILQTYLVPASIIGGLIGFVLINVGVIPLEPKQFINFSLHAFIISFISLCLTGVHRDDPALSQKEYLRGGMWMAFVWAGSVGLQAIVGGVVLLIYNQVTGKGLSELIGYLVTHGFTQGPGQGVTYGKIWADQSGLADLPVLGLIYANVGFIFAFIIGVPLARRIIKDGKNANKNAKIDEEFLTGIRKDKETHELGYEKLHPSNIDTLAFQLSILFICYGLTYLYLKYVLVYLQGVPVIGILSHWGFFFLHGLVVATVVRVLINKLGYGHMFSIKLQKHITGTAVDVLLVTSFMSISFTVLASYAGIIAMVSSVALASTFFYIWFFGRRLSYLGPERMISQLGCCTGATGNGLLLLRILDPNYSTGVAMELAFFNIAIVFTAFIPLNLIAPNVPQMSNIAIIGAYGAYTLLCFAAVWYLGRRVQAK